MRLSMTMLRCLLVVSFILLSAGTGHVLAKSAQASDKPGVPLLEHSLRAASQAKAGPPIFPSREVFVLPKEYGVPGRITIAPLAPKGLGGPVAPISRTEYDAMGGRLSYRISIFATTDDATRSFAWQVPKTRPKPDPIPGRQSVVPNLHDYTTPGFNVAAFVYRNIEVAVSTAATSRPIDIDWTASALYKQILAFIELDHLHLAPSPDTSGPAIVHPGDQYIIPDASAGGHVRLGYNDDAAVYSITPPGKQPTTYGLSHSYSIEPLQSDLIAQATRYDPKNDALITYLREEKWPFTQQEIAQPVIGGESAYWVRYTKSADGFHKGGGAYVRFVYRNVIVMVEWDVAGSTLNPTVLARTLQIAQAVVKQLRHPSHH